MAAVAGVTALEIVALLVPLKLYFNNVCTLCILTVCGLSIYLSAHILVATRWTKGSCTERAMEGVRRTFFPVVLGAASSSGVVMPRDFNYLGIVQKCFGMLTIVSIGGCLLNSVVFLPILNGFVPLAQALECWLLIISAQCG